MGKSPRDQVLRDGSGATRPASLYQTPGKPGSASPRVRAAGQVRTEETSSSAVAPPCPTVRSAGRGPGAASIRGAARMPPQAPRYAGCRTQQYGPPATTAWVRSLDANDGGENGLATMAQADRPRHRRAMAASACTATAPSRPVEIGATRRRRHRRGPRDHGGMGSGPRGRVSPLRTGALAEKVRVPSPDECPTADRHTSTRATNTQPIVQRQVPAERNRAAGPRAK